MFGNSPVWCAIRDSSRTFGFGRYEPKWSIQSYRRYFAFLQVDTLGYCLTEQSLFVEGSFLKKEIQLSRILAQLDVPPPAGYATWTGKLVAEALERAQGWLRLPDGQAVRRFNHEDRGKVVCQWFLASKYQILY